MTETAEARVRWTLARLDHECFACGRTIPAGTTYSRRIIFNHRGGAFTKKLCLTCHPEPEPEARAA